MAQTITMLMSKLDQNRIDSEFYQPKYLNLINKVKNLPFVRLGEICSIKSGSTPADRDDGLSDGIVLLKTVNIQEGFIDKIRLSYIDEVQDERLKSTRLEAKDIVLNIVGATLQVIGRIAIVPENFPKANITQAMVRIRIKDKNYLPEYIFAFLMSKFGKAQIYRAARPSNQYNLNQSEVANMLVPKLGMQRQKRIAEKIQVSLDKMVMVEQHYLDGEMQLLSALNFNYSDIKSDLTYSTNLSETKMSMRLDSEYFQPKYKKITKIIFASSQVKKLSELTIISKGIEIGSDSYREEGIPFVRVSNLSKYGINNNNQQYMSSEVYDLLKNNFEPKLGEILLSKDGTPGIAFLVDEQLKEIISSGILKLKIKSTLNPYYLTLVLNSIIIQSQIEQDAGGSIITHWKLDQVKNTLIPILDNREQEKIGLLLKHALDSRKDAKTALEDAKKIVEEGIA